MERPSTRAIVRGLRTAGAVAVAAALGLGCEDGLTRESAIGRANPPSQGEAPANVAFITLEFDLPAGYTDKAADGAYVIQGFRIGYFQADGTGPVRTVDFSRQAVEVRGETGRLRVPSFGLAPGSNVVVVRIQSVARGVSGPWSDPSSSVTLPIHVAPARAPRRAAGGAPPPSALPDLESYPALKAALTSLLSPDLTAADALTAFRRVDELAEAIVLAQRYKLSFAEVCRKRRGPPGRSNLDVLTAMRPELDARRAILEARPAGRVLLRRQPSKPQ